MVVIAAISNRSKSDPNSSEVIQFELMTQQLRNGNSIRSIVGRGEFCRQSHCRMPIDLLNPPLQFYSIHELKV
ncbi:MAG: hypothetical protein HC827_21525 [Cyanobacteria bacterium RM1_2_2]|nr:hypothetical protein [Cyanobacteria bacterium RM1_2_2]